MDKVEAWLKEQESLFPEAIPDSDFRKLLALVRNYKYFLELSGEPYSWIAKATTKANEIIDG